MLNRSAEIFAKPEHLLVLVQSSLVAGMAGTMLLAPRATPIAGALLLLCCIVADLWLPTAAEVRLDRLIGPVSLILAVLVVYGLASVVWSANPALALQSAVQLAAISATTIYVCEAVPRRLRELYPAARGLFIRAAPITFGLGVVVVAVDLFTGHRPLIALLAAYPDLAGVGRKGVIASGSTVTGILGFYVNQNMAALVLLLLLPTLACARLWLSEPLRTPLTALTSSLAVAVVLGSDSETAKLAAVVGLAVTLAALRWPQRVTTVIKVVFCVGLLFAPLFGRLPALAGLDTASWAPVGVRDRVAIWNATARASFEAPMRGIGIQSTRFTEVSDPSGQASSPAKPTAAAAPRRPASQLGWHSHNAYLQAWLELGALGVVILLALGLALIGYVAQSPPAIRPAALGLMAAALTIASDRPGACGSLGF